MDTAATYAVPVSVHLTRIYTRTGDDGTTGLADFSRTAKTDLRVAAYADCDETNAVIGVVLTLGSPSSQIADVLRRIQNELFDLGADLATPVSAQQNVPTVVPTETRSPESSAADASTTASATALRIDQTYIDRLEVDCDRFNAALTPLTSFVLPGGTPAAALLHHARTVTRRAERTAWALIESDAAGTNPLAARYLNRLSDLLFILCRAANPAGDVLWVPGGDR